MSERDAVTDDFPERFPTRTIATESTQIVAIIGRLVTPEQTAFHTRVAGFFTCVTQDTSGRNPLNNGFLVTSIHNASGLEPMFAARP
jgi:hypothetical protein